MQFPNQGTAYAHGLPRPAVRLREPAPRIPASSFPERIDNTGHQAVADHAAVPVSHQRKFRNKCGGDAEAAPPETVRDGRSPPMSRKASSTNLKTCG